MQIHRINIYIYILLLLIVRHDYIEKCIIVYKNMNNSNKMVMLVISKGGKKIIDCGPLTS